MIYPPCDFARTHVLHNVPEFLEDLWHWDGHRTIPNVLLWHALHNFTDVADPHAPQRLPHRAQVRTLSKRKTGFENTPSGSRSGSATDLGHAIVGGSVLISTLLDQRHEPDVWRSWHSVNRMCLLLHGLTLHNPARHVILRMHHLKQMQLVCLAL